MISELVNQHDLAARLKRSRAAIIRWGRQGMPIARSGGRGKPTLYRLPDVLTWLQETGRGQRPELPPLPLTGAPGADAVQTFAPAAGDPVAAASTSDRAEKEGPATGASAEDGFGYLEARAKREKFQSQIAEIDYLERIGHLVDAREARQFIFGAVRPLRDKLLAVRGLVQANCPELPARALEVIERAHRQALEDLAETFRRGFPKGQGQDADNGGSAP